MAKALVLNGTNFSTNKLTTITFGGTIPCTGITLDQSTKSVTSMSTFSLTATPSPLNTTSEISWSSSDETVATVISGTITPLKLGTTTITVTCGEYSATCAVTINNVIVPYVAVCGYSPFRRSSNEHAMTLGKNSSALAQLVIAADQSTGLYPIESKSDIDTSPYRFVPIIIPNGATKFTISTSLGNEKIKTRILYCNSTLSSQSITFPNDAAYCLQGSTGDWDQDSTASTPLEFTIPNNLTGLDSMCLAMVIGGSWAGTDGTDYSSNINITFSYEE